MTNFFQFESDFVESLRCIPMQVRMKLDTCGIKLKLQDWNKFTAEERQQLVDLPCAIASEVETYRQFLNQLVIEQTGLPAKDLPVEDMPAWMDDTNIPIAVQEKSQELGATIAPSQWQTLTALQRFALIKLSRSSHENSNFLPALKEFQIIDNRS
jgi:hypothetical protein